MNEHEFTWVKTHKDLVEFLKTKEHSQIELINLLKSVGIQPFNDKSEPGEQNIELNELDPFTFFCYINKYGSQKRLEYLQDIAKKLEISIPSDEKGLPTAQAQKVWLFPYKYARTNKEIPRLWDFFKKALGNNIKDSDFDDILKIGSIGKTKITEALFYIDPEKYLPINGPTKSYIEQILNLNPNFISYSDYLSLLNKIKSEIDIPFYELSYRAWVRIQNENKEMNDYIIYSDQLLSFLEQAKTDNLKTKHYLKSYSGTTVKVSFGQGVEARIPWISFLKEPNTTSNGIYPVYLFFKKENILVLAYGISETTIPNEHWELESPTTINDLFLKNDFSKPDRYGDSFVFKTYNVESLPENKILDKDLQEILAIYSKQNKINLKQSIQEIISFDVNSFNSNLDKSGLIFSTQLVNRFIASLCTKPFVICSGLSGSGKTKLAQAFAQWITANESQFVIVPVGADWTNREPLLGYPNALDKEEYVSPENGVLDLMIRAKLNIENSVEPTKPYFLILDEMNLSHVERYFADFLSTMESGDKIPLHKIQNDSLIVPPSIKLPKNLFIIGTVNIDETTYMFSPKVLDRANTIEFRLTEKDLADFIASDKKLDMDLLKAQGANMAESFMTMALQETDKNLKPTEADLKLFFSELKKSGAEFGYRTASEIGRLMYMLEKLGESGDNLLDIAIMQKLLPKLHGSRNKLTKVLPILGGFCLTDNSKIKEDYLDKFVGNSLTEAELKSDINIKYKISFEKICRMYKNAVENGFASYAEA